MAQTPTGWNGGRFNNIPGMNRDNAPFKPVDQNLIMRIGEGIREFFGMHPGVTGRELPFFPPGQPLPQVAARRPALRPPRAQYDCRRVSTGRSTGLRAFRSSGRCWDDRLAIETRRIRW
jgi:hypothetical protein